MTRAREASKWVSTGVTSTEIDKLDGFTGTVDDLNYAKDLRAEGVTTTEFDYLDGVSSNVQTQLNAKQATITTGISNTNVLVANANVADNDFLRVDGTSIEGRTASETLGDIGGIGSSDPTVTLGGNATFPAGHVIQTGHSRSTQTSISHTNGATYTAAGFPVSLTALQTNGKYYVTFFSGRIDSNGTDNRMATTLFKDENSAGYSECSGIHADTGLNMELAGNFEGSAHFSYVYTASITAGQTIAFQVYYKKVSGSGTSVHLTNGGNEFEFIVQELAL